MNKPEPITTEVSLSWKDVGAEGSAGTDLAVQIMNAMEQGIIVWSSQGYCELHNTRVYPVLELRAGDLSIGTKREEFLQRAHERGEFSAEALAENMRRFEARLPFQFDRKMPSGRVVATYARPTREGGYVVTFTDVTEARQAADALAEAKQAAEEAEARARDVLQEERARRAEARTLADLDEWLQSCKSLTELYRIVAKFMGYLIPDSVGELYLYSNSRDVLDGACAWGQDEDIKDHITPDCCWSLRRGRMYEHHPDALCLPCDHLDEAETAPPGHYVCIPVIAHGDTVGLLHIHYHQKMSYNDVKTMSRFASKCAEHISMAIANVKLRDELHDQSIRDPLTSLYNRRYFMDAMRREAAAADRGGEGFGLICLDADKFKTFNDNHGHDAGDLVLRSLAERMLANMNDAAICARVGGEEFAIMLPKTTKDDAIAMAEVLRQDVAKMVVRTAFGTLPRVTISAGIATYTGCGVAPSVVVKRADEALYEAKAKGRNCVVVAED